jgi:TRAP transporter 4TM/12TM fusion protein
MALEPSLGIARNVLRAILFFATASWAASLPTILRVLVYDEQFILPIIGLACALAFLGEHKNRAVVLRVFDIILAVMALGVFGYVAVALIPKPIFNPPHLIWLSSLMLLMVLEATRRKTGPVLLILVGLLVLFFTMVGPNLPPSFQTLPLTFTRQVPALAMDNVAMLGRIMVIVGLVVIPFIVFGFLLNSFGGSAFFTGLATRLVGGFRGGPAKVSVVGSAAFGMVSGSAVANVVAVGAVSIPLMSKTGYKRHVAAAIEAVTSTGGQLMPPIMGASAFLMAEFLEIPYATIVVAAILPAMFYYVALFLAVDFEARRLDIQAVSPESLGLNDGAGWTKGWPYLIPVAVLLYLLFVEGKTAGYSGFYTVISIMAVHMFWPNFGPIREFSEGAGYWAIQRIMSIPKALTQRFRLLVSATLNCMGAATEIILLAATAGIIIGLLNKTGFSSAVTNQMVLLSQGNIAILLVLTGVMGIVLGMGMPTVGVYILLALLAAPALVKLGVEPLAAHLYVLYFGMLSMITPPVAIASFAAASVAGTNPWSTSFSSIRVGAGVYLVPIAFVTQPELIFIGDLSDTMIAGMRLLVSVCLFTTVFIGHAVRKMPWALRLIGAPIAVLNVMPLSGNGFDTYLWIAFAVAVILMGLHLMRGRDTGHTGASVAESAALD